MSPLGSDDIDAILLSLRVSAVAAAFGMPVALAIALLLARGRFFGRPVLDALTQLPLVLPPVATGFALLLVFGREGAIGRPLSRLGIVLAFHWTGAALAAGVMALPLMIRPIRQAIEAIDPQLEEAARSLGAGPLACFARITAPLAAPGFIAAAILGFARALGEFGATVTFAAAIPGETLTLPTDIYQATQTPGDERHALLLCAVAALIALAAVFASEPIALRLDAGRRRKT
jgi:molybdate transport system permease protein